MPDLLDDDRATLNVELQAVVAVRIRQCPASSPESGFAPLTWGQSFSRSISLTIRTLITRGS